MIFKYKPISEITKSLFKAVAFGALVATTPVLTGCSDDINLGGQGVYGDLGDKVHATVSVTMADSKPITVSRKLDFSDDAQIKIDSYWVGIFDTQTGELIGTKFDAQPRKDNGTRYTLKEGATPFTVQDIDIYYYTNNPNAYIVGVINYNNILAKNAGDQDNVPLFDLLKAANTLTDIAQISVDTRSVDAANYQEKSGYQETPLMMGFYATHRTSVHPTIDANGRIVGAQDEVKTRLTPEGSDFSNIKLPEGNIQMQRLIAELNIRIAGGQYFQIKNVEYMVCNTPGEMFLAEHPTDVQAASRSSKEDFLKNTANSADYTENYSSDSNFRYAEYFEEEYYDDYYYTEEGFRFSIQHYENKHWGDESWTKKGTGSADGPSVVPIVSQHALREAKFDKTAEKPVFKTLCSTEANPWNNSASYIVLKIDYLTYGYNVEMNPDFDWSGGPQDRYDSPYDAYVQNGQEGTAYYTIHEGYICAPDGSVTSIPQTRLLDYQTVRNTTYTYNITFNGLNDLNMNVYSDESGIHNDGVTGEAWTVSFVSVSPKGADLKNTTGFMVTPEQRKNLKFLYGATGKYSSPDGLYGIVPESKPDAPEEFQEFFGSADEMPDDYVKSPELMPEKLKNALKIVSVDGTVEMTLPEFIASTDTKLDNPEMAYYIKVEPFVVDDYSTEYTRMFMIYFEDEHKDADGCARRDHMLSLQQTMMDTRPYFPAIVPVPNEGYREDYSLAYWTGAPYITTYFNWTFCAVDENGMRDEYNPDDFTPENDPLNFDYYMEIRYHNSYGGSNYYRQYGPFNAREYYNEQLNAVSFPVTMEYGSRTYSYDNYYDVVLYPDDESKDFVQQYDPSYASRSVYDGLYVVRTHSSVNSNNSYYPNYSQWQFVSFDYNHGAMGYNPFWYFYRFDYNYYSTLNYGGLTVVADTSGSRSITAPYNYTDGSLIYGDMGNGGVLMFGGGGTFNEDPSRDKLVAKFSVDRPGTILVYYSYPSNRSSGNGQIIVKTRDGSQQVVRDLPEATYKPDAGKIYSMMIYGYGGVGNFDWGTSGRLFEDGPKEIGVLSGNGSLAIHAIHFVPYN